MRLPKSFSRGLAAVASVSMLAMAFPATPLAAQTAAPPPMVQAKPNNCGTPDVGRYGSAGKSQCDSSQLLTIGPAENQVVTMDDTGFHPREVTVGGGGGLTATVTFVNLGTQVHTATQTPDSPMWSMGSVGGINVNGSGQKGVKVKGKGVSELGSGSIAIFDTGGITPNPGGTVQSSIQMGAGNGVAYVSFGADGDYVYTSYPDCLAADRPGTTAFDCKKAIVHVVDNQEGDKELQKVLGPAVKKLGSGAAVGTVLRPLGDKDCATLAANAPIMAPGRTNACVSSIRTNQFQKKSAASSSKPYLSDPMIGIDDIYGFDPASITIAVGVPMTFTNNPTNLLIHSVEMKPSSNRPISLGSPPSGLIGGGLQPGQSWTFSGAQFVPSGSLGWQSDTESDLLDSSLNGFGGTTAGQVTAFLGKASVICPPGTFTSLSFDQLRGLGQPCQDSAPAQDPAVTTPGTVHDY
jgi:plastocyanin